jgi:nicotinamide-nucleotide amidase
MTGQATGPWEIPVMRCEIVAVGTELLLGQITDTNSSWMGEQLAAAGIDSHFQTKVGDNLDRIVLAIRTALSRSDAVICCGGLGPTQDDITREAIAVVMNAALERVPEMESTIRAMFTSRGRAMPEMNMRQAERPIGSRFIDNDRGTAPGLIAPVGKKVVYAVPGVPFEMQVMIERVVLPDLIARTGQQAVIASRVLRTWGLAESAVAEIVAPRLDALDADPDSKATIAFLASGIEGIKVRVTAKASSDDEVRAVLDAEEAQLRPLLGTHVFGVDDDTMERVIGRALQQRGWTLAVAESLTGGLVASRIVGVPGASAWFRGGVVSYATDVKHSVLGVPDGPVVSAETAAAMATGVRDKLGADVGLGITGVAGPDEQEGQPVGTVFGALALPDGVTTFEARLPGDRERVRQYATITLLDRLRLRLPA